MIKRHIKHIEVYVLTSHPDVVWVPKEDVSEFLDCYVDTAVSSNEYTNRIYKNINITYDGVRLRFESSFVAKNKANILRESWSPEHNHTLNSVQDITKYGKYVLHIQKPLSALPTDWVFSNA